MNACSYCGMAADSRDHVMPKSVARLRQALGLPYSDVTVWCCRECNSLAGNQQFATRAEKRRFVHERIRARYKHELEMPDWSPTDLAALGLELRRHIRRSLVVREITRERLAWRGKAVAAVAPKPRVRTPAGETSRRKANWPKVERVCGYCRKTFIGRPDEQACRASHAARMAQIRPFVRKTA